MQSILILTQYYPPEMGAPQARLSELAIGLKQRGLDVRVLTALPNYPTGRVLKGYRKLRLKEVIDGIPVVRTWLFPTQSAGLLPRLLSYFSFVFSSLLLGVWGLGKIDYLLTESPPLFLGISGYLLSRIKHARWIFNVSDLWPGSVVSLGLLKAGWALRMSEKLEAFCYKKAWLVTGQSKEILSHIQAMFPGLNTFHLSNGVDVTLFSPQRFDPAIRAQLSPGGETVVLYAGLHGLAQGLGQVLQLATHFPEKVRFVFIGDGPEKKRLLNLANSMHLQNVFFMDIVPKDQMPAYLASADICIVPLCTTIPGAVPSKIYEAMASAKPVLLMAEGEASTIVEQNHAGLSVAPYALEAARHALKELLLDSALRKSLGENGRSAAVSLFSRGKIIDGFCDFLLNDCSQTT